MGSACVGLCGELHAVSMENEGNRLLSSPARKSVFMAKIQAVRLIRARSGFLGGSERLQAEEGLPEAAFGRIVVQGWAGGGQKKARGALRP